jgi:hypothetical protein
VAEAGLDLLWSRAYVAADIGRMDFWATGVASFRVLLPRAGAFVDGLERASAERRFFGASNFYTYVARRGG